MNLLYFLAPFLNMALGVYLLLFYQSIFPRHS